MLTDQVSRLDTKTDEITEYLLPRTTNIRRVFVDEPARGRCSGSATITAPRSSGSSRWIDPRTMPDCALSRAGEGVIAVPHSSVRRSSIHRDDKRAALRDERAEGVRRQACGHAAT